MLALVRRPRALLLSPLGARARTIAGPMLIMHVTNRRRDADERRATTSLHNRLAQLRTNRIAHHSEPQTERVRTLLQLTPPTTCLSRTTCVTLSFLFATFFARHLVSPLSSISPISLSAHAKLRPARSLCTSMRWHPRSSRWNTVAHANRHHARHKFTPILHLQRDSCVREGKCQRGWLKIEGVWPESATMRRKNKDIAMARANCSGAEGCREKYRTVTKLRMMASQSAEEWSCGSPPSYEWLLSSRRPAPPVGGVVFTR